MVEWRVNVNLIKGDVHHITMCTYVLYENWKTTVFSPNQAFWT